MNRKFTSLLSCAALGLGLLATQQVNAQLTRNYATTAVSHSTTGLGSYNVPDYANASDGNLSTSATLKATRTLVLETNSFTEVGFGANLPVNTDVYVVLSTNQNNLLDAIISGSIGNLVTDLVDNAGFDITVKSASSTIGTYNSRNGNTTGSTNFDFEIGPEGLTYIKVNNASQSIRNIRITAKQDGLLGSILNGDLEINFHDAFYLSGSELPCEPFLTTTFDAPGLSAALLNNEGDPVRNPEFAIDGDPTTYSELGYSGVINLSILSSYTQDIIFRELSNAGDDAAISFQIPSSLLTASVLNDIEVTAYNGATAVMTTTFSSLLDAELLALISLNIGSVPAVATIDIPGNAQFDRIRISTSQLLNANVNTPLRIYDVYKVSAVPVLADASIESCELLPVDLTVTNVQSGVAYTWYDTDFNVVSTGTTYTVNAPAEGSTDTFLVASNRCPDQFSTPLVVTVSSLASACAPSDVAGTVDESDYEGSNPLYAVLVDDNGNVVETTPVDPTTGAYSFDETDRGTYSVYIMDSNPSLGSPVSAHDVPYGYVVSPTPITITIDGSGDPASGNDYSVVWEGPDLVASALASPTSLANGQTATITYTITNFGLMPTEGEMRVLITRPTIAGAGVLTLDAAPSGWTIASTTDGSYILESTTAIAQGPANAVNFTATFTATETPVSLNLLFNSGGGSERTTTNNRSSVGLQTNQ